MKARAKAAAAHHLKQLRGHPFPPALYPDPDRVHLSALRSAASPRLSLAACACLRCAGLPPPGRRALPALLRAAARCEDDAAAFVAGAHGMAVRVGVQDDGFVGTALVRAYASSGCVTDARNVFDGMTVRDVVAWGVMLDGYCQTQHYDEALLLFGKMKRSGVVPDQLILATVVSACAHTNQLRTGKALHSYMLVSDVFINAHLSSALINLYASCGNMEMAEKLYNRAQIKDLVSSTAMIFGCAKNGNVEIARSIFDGMPEKDVVSWSAMISAYTACNQPIEAFNLFNDMREHGVRPDEITMLSVISACANMGSLDKARWIHSFIENHGLSKTLRIYNALIDMFSKCGGLSIASNIFKAMPRKNVVTWTSMISALAMHGEGRSALDLFEQMRSQGVEPNEVTFLGLLHACCHAGLVDEGRSLFRCMVQECRMVPNHGHYGCMVDLLGRAKLLPEAVELIESMPLRPNVAIWCSLLAACWMHGDVKLGAFAAKNVLALNPKHDGASVLLSKIYAQSGSWNEAQEIRGAMKQHGVSKESGSSWMELDGEKRSENDKIIIELDGKMQIEDVPYATMC
ncbi:hypothetical protein QOZ80_9BG0710400 [Eleusine coracana subsp. coracana]|nr:hypothetical protein QOZ80_9BG0710400 [Eleusine coracana subsp. coracana]